ncbi:uncharacterized protein TRIVIDRAFT_180677 [Trichoderma virens Gv29-8]|uniref:RING-type E3 ubiquitin transferase n=1 Tax=Hypocrea virens (strain Gv29-8 / FGSC 10586) TaxID=413071 RepID=G9MWJ3_HYPVG|nr:uncharacterized protein TRIVIDRAFT_180677 [Trichoderma virens Gv29-8]EHK21160.1 hypothetical protein TRIVIDRAFT_180677 [Trichoderma virens Gv29-8]
MNDAWNASDVGPAAQPREPTRHDDGLGAATDTAPSICRICRGEGTPAEPLFYPCKCSGSIKYVHQDCLMEWLSHSQKKYCELCKTPFRFTKLYAPDMPQSLPVHIFVEHMAKYLFRNFLVWLRAAVAISVWVFWLPYFMRAVWSFMFWVSDEGPGAGSIMSRINETNNNNTMSTIPSSILAIGTCPASPLLAATTTSAAEVEAVVGQLQGKEVSDYFVRFLLGSFTSPLLASDGELGLESNASAAPNNGSQSFVTSTLLGNVAFIGNLTRSASLNRAIVSVLEGQVITVLVIISFILIILVRDYVVQQQPEINMRAAFAAPENDFPIPVPEIAQPEPLPPNPEPTDSDDDTLEDSDQAGAPDWRMIRLMPAHHLVIAGEQPLTPDSSNHSLLDNEPVPTSSTNTSLQNDQLNSQAREGADDGDAAEERATVEDYLRIYRRANGDFHEILRIIEEEGLQEKLKYWVDVTRRSTMDNADQPAEDEDHHEQEVGSDHDTLPSPSTWKGKEPAWSPVSVDADMPGPSAAVEDDLFGITPRPRSMSEGFQEQQFVNPLANNSWSFDALPTDDKADEEPQSLPVIQEQTGQDLGDMQPVDQLEDQFEEQFEDQLEDQPEDQDYDFEAQPPRVNAAADEAVINGGDAPAAGLVDRVADFMWGNLNEPDAVEAGPAADIAAQQAAAAAAERAAARRAVAEQVAAENDELWAGANGEDGDGMPADGNGAAFDPEAIDDLEDFEGVMELIGMRGPIAGLFQNAIFCAVLVSVTIFACIFLPYNIGRVSVWLLASPMRVVRLLFELSKMLQDATFLVGGLCSWGALNIVDMFSTIMGASAKAHILSARKMSWGLWTGAASRLSTCLFIDFFPMTTTEIHNFSAVSHDALNTVKTNIVSVLYSVRDSLSAAHDVGFDKILSTTMAVFGSTSETALKLSSQLMKPSSWVIDLSLAEEWPAVDPQLAHWSSIDRFWAILAGYATVFLIGALYLKKGSPFSRGTTMHAWEAGVIDFLQQASGIIKVILIISIEMLVFPLYCGLLLDAALLPLFEGTTLTSRIVFTCKYPMTSVFVHWFVGTGYMFHFALFVSMCRKIMRPGVLYFIRDPDDPEFHPVRDVLERNLTTQLRKILFSAFVYGALVIVCLGGVVWGLSFAMPGVLPIHYSSNEPVLEFPVDLLFYNFLMPLAVKFFKPSDAMHTMYTWWFRRCARALRLTYFLFGERRIDEEGDLYLRPGTTAGRFPQSGILLELGEGNEIVPKTWRDTFEGGDLKPNTITTSEQRRDLRRRKAQLVESHQLVKDGRFVRAPASDRIKIPKGQKIFLTVSERNRRKDGRSDDDLYSSDQYLMVYVPPNFRARVFLFILFIWLFASVTGVGFTIIPLVFGRRIFKELIPHYIRTNDIYAFSIGVFLLGSVAYSIFHYHVIKEAVQKWTRQARRDLFEGKAVGRGALIGLRLAKLFYVYFVLLIVFPLLTSMLMELYVTIPLHTYMYPPTAISTLKDQAVDCHTVRVIQSWVLGLLYLKLGSRLITSLFPDSRAATAVRSIMRRGWLRPDVRLLTRAFVIPGLMASCVAIFGPPMMAGFVIKHGGLAGGSAAEDAAEAVRLTVLYRQSYPAAAFAAILAKHAVGLVKVTNRWTAGVRDEAYLIGERLHNFGSRASGTKRSSRSQR